MVSLATNNTGTQACDWWSIWRQSFAPCQLCQHVFAKLDCLNLAHAVIAKRRNSVQDLRFVKDESVHMQICFFAADVAVVTAKLHEQTIESSSHEFVDYVYLLANRYVRSVLAGRNACVKLIHSHAVASK